MYTWRWSPRRCRRRSRTPATARASRGLTSIDLRDAIADAAQIADQLRGELAPEVVQMHFDAVRLDFLAPAVHRFLELLPRHHRAGLLQQGLEHGELARRELDGPAAERDAPARRIDDQRAEADLGRSAADAAADHRAYAREQLVETERLHQVIVGAAVEAGDA